MKNLVNLISSFSVRFQYSKLIIALWSQQIKSNKRDWGTHMAALPKPKTHPGHTKNPSGPFSGHFGDPPARGPTGHCPIAQSAPAVRLPKVAQGTPSPWNFPHYERNVQAV